MSRFAEPMTRLIDELKKLPGIGSKSAQRLAFHILRSSADDAEALQQRLRVDHVHARRRRWIDEDEDGNFNCQGSPG